MNRFELNSFLMKFDVKKQPAVNALNTLRGSSCFLPINKLILGGKSIATSEFDHTLPQHFPCEQ